MATMPSKELAEDVNKIIWTHNVVIAVTHNWGAEEEAYCFSCGYLGLGEEPSLHAANIVIEYLEEYYKERFSNGLAGRGQDE